MSDQPSENNKPLTRDWTPDDLCTIWRFAQHDFARFMEILLWMDGQDRGER